MFSRIIVVSLFLWRFGSSISTNDCPSDLSRDEHLTVFQNKCYYLYLNIARDFNDAQSVCQEKGGNLASVKTSEVNDFIWRRVKNRYHYGDKVWIGLSDRIGQGEYEWMDGSKLDFANFEYNDGYETRSKGRSKKIQDCVTMKSLNGKWTNATCSDTFLVLHRNAFVCEYSPKQFSQRDTDASQTTLQDCPSSVPRDRYIQRLDNSCYYFHLNSQRDYPTAQDTCEQLGGYLVSIKSQKVLDFILVALRYTYNLNNYAWIGLSVDVTEGRFVWRDGSAMKYENFADGEKNGLGLNQNCVAMSGISGKWHVFDCTDTFFRDFREYFICEFSAASTPSVTTRTTTEAATISTSIYGTNISTASLSTTTPTKGPTMTATTATPTTTITTPTTTTTTPTTTTTTPTTTITTPIEKTTFATSTTNTQITPTTPPATTPQTRLASPTPEDPSSVFPKATTPAIPTQCPLCNLDCGDHGYILYTINSCIICECLRD